MPKGKSIPRKQAGFAREKPPRPCPQCHLPMIDMGADVFECRKHGKPTRA